MVTCQGFYISHPATNRRQRLGLGLGEACPSQELETLDGPLASKHYRYKLREALMFEGLLQPMHLLVIALAIFFLGPKKLPEMAKGLGEGIRGFKAALSGSEKLDPPGQV